VDKVNQSLPEPMLVKAFFSFLSVHGVPEMQTFELMLLEKNRNSLLQKGDSFVEINDIK